MARWADRSAKSIPLSVDADNTCDSVSPAACDRVRVVHVVNGEYYSGAERVQDLLAANLPREGFDVGFACLKPVDFPRLRHHQEAPLYALPMRSRLDLRVAGELCALIGRHGYRMVHAHTPRSALIGRLAAMRTGVPFVYHVHSPTCRDSTNRLRNGLNRLAERLSLRHAGHLIAVSSSLGCHMQRLGHPASRVAVVRNGVPRPAVMRDTRPPGHEWTLGIVALFRPRKGLEVLLEALARLRRHHLPVRLRAVGRFESRGYERRVLEQVQQLDLGDCIDWVGFREDVSGELAQTDLLVLPSLFGEGLPMVVLEAMASGVPVVATRVEGVPEAVDDGVQGLLVRPNDPDELARGIERIVSGEIDWAILRQNAMLHHAECFSERSMAAGVAEVYRTVLARHTTTAQRAGFRSLANAALRLALWK
ncbi:MAG: glycosyltransferase [Pirellulaceae bacterium]